MFGKPRHEHTWKYLRATWYNDSWGSFTVLSRICTECKKTSVKEVRGRFNVEDFD